MIIAHRTFDLPNKNNDMKRIGTIAEVKTEVVKNGRTYSTCLVNLSRPVVMVKNDEVYLVTSLLCYINLMSYEVIVGMVGADGLVDLSKCPNQSFLTTEKSFLDDLSFYYDISSMGEFITI